MSEKWLAIDPGEDTGWSLWEDSKLVESGTEKMWEFGDAVFRAVFHPYTGEVFDDEELAGKFVGVKKLVVEDWRIYPWEAKKGTMNWDQCRTARLIGALTIIARQGGLEFTLQPAKIKERAEAAGAEVYFSTPLHENRHANDAIRHGVYHLAIERGASAIPEQEMYAEGT